MTALPTTSAASCSCRPGFSDWLPPRSLMEPLPSSRAAGLSTARARTAGGVTTHVFALHPLDTRCHAPRPLAPASLRTALDGRCTLFRSPSLSVVSPPPPRPLAVEVRRAPTLLFWASPLHSFAATLQSGSTGVALASPGSVAAADPRPSPPGAPLFSGAHRADAFLFVGDLARPPGCSGPLLKSSPATGDALRPGLDSPTPPLPDATGIACTWGSSCLGCSFAPPRPTGCGIGANLSLRATW